MTAAEELEVVGHHEDRSDDEEGDQRPAHLDDPGDAEGHGPGQPDAGDGDEGGAGIRVRSGRPCSSSSAWAARPTARKNASRVAISRVALTTGARQAPMTT